MNVHITRLWREHRLLSIAFIVALLLTLFFGVRMVVFTVYWMDPAHQDQALESWMTPRYVAHSYDLPPEVTARAIGIPFPPERRGRTLAEIARAQDTTLADLQARIEAAAQEHRGE